RRKTRPPSCCPFCNNQLMEPPKRLPELALERGPIVWRKPWLRAALRSHWRAVVRFERKGFFHLKIRLALQQPHAAIPAQDRVVIPRRANLFCFCEALQRLFQKWQQSVW